MIWRERLFLFMCLVLLSGGATAQHIQVVGEPANAYHREFFDALRQGVGQSADLTLRAVEAPVAAGPRPDLIITLGEAAAAQEAGDGEPVLHVFITQEQFHAIQARGVPKGHSAIFLEQPPERYVALVHAALPGVSRLLVPTGPAARAGLGPLQQAAERAGITVQAVTVTSPGSMDELLGGSDRAHDALLFLPDPALRANAIMKVAVVGAYRRQLPLVAYSEGLVKAGALMSVHTTVPLLARQVSEWVSRFSNERTLPPPAFPARFDVAVNYELARSLGLQIPEKPLLYRRVMEQNGGGSQ